MLAKWASAPKNATTSVIDEGMKKRIWSRIVSVKQIDAPMIKATIWLRVRDDANIPMEQNAPESRIAPIYPPRSGPGSTSPINEIKTG